MEIIAGARFNGRYNFVKNRQSAVQNVLYWKYRIEKGEGSDALAFWFWGLDLKRHKKPAQRAGRENGQGFHGLP
jgi:hypothetical protein